jgi:hypothetical protein
MRCCPRLPSWPSSAGQSTRCSAHALSNAWFAGSLLQAWVSGQGRDPVAGGAGSERELASA